eukprot:m.515012 g.515012  ORF g.515012 m.515012 type:complete len:340 (-) comp21917_c0_seq3:490-1509(-)
MFLYVGPVLPHPVHITLLAQVKHIQGITLLDTGACMFFPNTLHVYSCREGHAVNSVEMLTGTETLYLFEGGQFLWPGIHIGYKRSIAVDDGTGTHTQVHLETLSLRPLAFRVMKFVTGDECKHVVKVAKERIRRSSVYMTGVAENLADQSRTSSDAKLARGETPQMKAMEHRAHNLTRLPYELGESLQVVKYDEGQKYEAHRDFFHPNEYQENPGALQMVGCGARNRLATVFWYLNTVTAGGETYFPRSLNASGLETNPWNYDYKDCYRGLAVPPKQGTAVLFYSMLPNAELDERSLHGGCPPRDGGKKWGANQWIYNRVETPVASCKRITAQPQHIDL